MNNDNPHIISAAYLYKEVEAIYQLANNTAESLRAKNRKREVVLYRQAFCYLAKKNHSTFFRVERCSFTALAGLLNQNHATIIHAVKKATMLLWAKDKVFNEVLHSIIIILNNRHDIHYREF